MPMLVPFRLFGFPLRNPRHRSNLCMKRMISNAWTRATGFAVVLTAAFLIAAPAGADRGLSVVIKGTDGTQTTKSLTVADNDPIDAVSIALLLGVTEADIVSITDTTPTTDTTSTTSTSTTTTSTTTTTTTQPVPPKPGRGKGDHGTKKPKPGAGKPTVFTGAAMLGLPGLTPLGTPGELIAEFRIPPFLLPIYQAAGIEYGIPWQVLAAINSVETDYGRNLSVSSAGALGWMQFMPASWAAYGVDANGDGKADPYNPADAIFTAAKYLKAAGGSNDLHAAIFSYNHAEWYVSDVLKRARMLAGLPEGIVESLTGLAQASSPVPGSSKVEKTPEANGEASAVTISTKPDSPVVAVADGKVTNVGYNPSVGNFVVLEDSFGNHFMYAGLGRVSRRFVTRKPRSVSTKRLSTELKLPLHPENGSSPASKVAAAASVKAAETAPQLVPDSGGRRRLFANPARPNSLEAGGARQLKEAEGPADLHDWFTVPVRIARSEAVVKPLSPGSVVIAGTILGHVNSPTGAPRGTVRFSIRPAGEGSPVIDPRPIINGWELLAKTAHGAGTGNSNKLHADGATPVSLTAPSIGQVMLMSKSDLAAKVLKDSRITIYDCGRRDIEAGLIDARVLATLTYLADRNMNPTVSCLQCGHSLMTKSGNVSEHSFGSAVDIAAINGIPILGNQGAGSITDQVVRLLSALQGTMRPHQIITLMKYPGVSNTLALSDHDDHIHVGFQPEAGAVARDGSTRAQTGSSAVGGPATGEQWAALVNRLREMPNPHVTTKASRYATSAKRS